MAAENWLKKRDRIGKRAFVWSALQWLVLGALVFLPLMFQAAEAPINAQTRAPTSAAQETVQALKQLQWNEREEGLDVLRAVTQSGLVLTAYRISPENFSIEVALQTNKSGSRVRDIAEASGAVLAVNGGFFALGANDQVYSVGYLRKDGRTISKGWPQQGGLIQFTDNGITLSPSHQGIPVNEHDVLQSRPMILEPGGVWAMTSDSGVSKLRSLLCTLPGGEIVIVVISRVGLSIFEAGWLLRSEEDGGFFGCDAAVALDGGRSTQVWDSDEPSYSYSGLADVHNFLVVRSKRR